MLNHRLSEVGGKEGREGGKKREGGRRGRGKGGKEEGRRKKGGRKEEGTDAKLIPNIFDC